MFVFVVFHKFTCHVSVFSFFKYIMYYIIANIWVCCQTFISILSFTSEAHISIFILFMTSPSCTYFLVNLGLLLPKNVKSNVIKQGW